MSWSISSSSREQRQQGVLWKRRRPDVAGSMLAEAHGGKNNAEPAPEDEVAHGIGALSPCDDRVGHATLDVVVHTRVERGEQVGPADQFTPSVPLLLVHDVAQRLAAHEATDVVEEHFQVATGDARRVAGHMRREDDPPGIFHRA